jgi:hypothetical protein
MQTGSEAKSGPAFPKVYVLLAAVLVLALYNVCIKYFQS